MSRLTAQDFSRLAESESPADRLQAAKSRRCPPEIILKLTDDRDIDVEREAWRNPKLPSERIEWGLSQLSHGTSGDWALRNGLPMNPAITASQCRRFQTRDLISHPNYPVDLMHAIMDRDGSLPFPRRTRPEWERETLAGNRNLPQDIQLRLARDTYVYVRKVLAKNRRISAETVAVLKNDESSTVLRALLGYKLAAPYRQEILARLVEISEGVHTEAAVARWTEDEEVLAAAVRSGRNIVVANAVRNEKITDGDLNQAALSREPSIRKAARRNPRLDEGYIVGSILLED